ncbi:uncharacterized protein V6R79_008090 [Siganus canaliculatus]
MAEEHTFGGSRPRNNNHLDRNTDHHQRPLDSNLKSSFVAEERVPAPPDVAQKDSFSPEASPVASGTGAKLQATDCRDRTFFTADFGKATSFDENNLDFLLQTMQREYQHGDPMQSAGSQPETDTNKEDGREEEKEEKTLHSVLRQMQQQQMHKRGWKFKKKTLVKMSKLFVIAEGWDPKMTETSDVSFCSGASAEFRFQTETLKEETLTSAVCTDMTLPLKKRKRPSVCKKQTNKESETQCRTNLPAGMTDSLTPKDPEINKLFGNSPAQTSSVDAPQTSFKGRRRKTAKASRVGVKKSSRQKRRLHSLGVSSDELSSVQDAVHAVKPEQDKTQSSDTTSKAVSSCRDETSPVHSAPSVMRTGRRMDQLFLSHVSTDATFSDRTAKRRKAASSREKQVKKESESVLISSPETASDEQRKTRNSDSVALKEDPEIPATKQALKGSKRKTNISRVGVRKSSRLKVLPLKDHSMQEVSECVVMSPDERHHGASILNDAKEEHSETSVAASLFVAEVNRVESAPSARLPLRKTTRRRRRKKQPQWAQRRTLKQSSAPAKMEASTSPCRSASGHKVHGRRGDLKPKKPVWCSFCCRSFRHITAFTHHKRLHSGEKPFSCPTCGKRFSQRSKLRIHSRLHSPDPLVGCPCCSKSFKTKEQLILHFHVHMSATRRSKVKESAAGVDSRKHFRRKFCSGLSSAEPQTLPSGSCSSDLCPSCRQQYQHPAEEPAALEDPETGQRSASPPRETVERLVEEQEPSLRSVSSYPCLQCDASFSRLGALNKHLKSHRTRVQVPQPVGLVQPLSFPYECQKCPAKFSSTDLLQAHQVCHYEPGTDPEPPRGHGSEPRWRLKASNKKDLFRYPHPDLLYVVPAAPSEEEQDPQVQSPSSTTSVPSRSSEIQPGPASSHVPQSCQDLSGPHPDQDDAEEETSVSSGSEAASPEPCLVFSEHVVQSCVVCMEPFTDESELHEHYIEHTRRRRKEEEGGRRRKEEEGGRRRRKEGELVCSLEPTRTLKTL